MGWNPRSGKECLLAFLLLGPACIGAPPQPPFSPEPTPPAVSPESGEQEWPDWPMARGGPQHLGARGRLTAGTGLEVWNTSVPNDAYSLSVVGHMLLVYAYRAVYALNLSTGALAWQHRFSEGVCCEPVMAHGLAYMAGGSLYAYDPATNATRWKADFAPEVPASSPAIAHGAIYVGTTGPLFAFAAATGRQLWKHSFSNPYGKDTESPPVHRDGAVYVGSSGQQLRKFDAEDGTLLWEYRTVAGTVSSPAVWNGTVYVASNGRPWDLIAVDAATGAYRWTHEAADAIPHPPVVEDGTVYLYDWHNTVRAVDAGNGSLRWRFRTPGSYTCVGLNFCFKEALGPAVLDGVVFVVSHNEQGSAPRPLNATLYALDGATGAELWNRTLPPGRALASPVVVGNRVFVGLEDRLYAFEWGGTPPSRS